MFGSNGRLDPAWLTKIDAFADFDRDALDQIAALGERIDVDGGTTLLDQGRVGTACYVIVEGDAEVSTRGMDVATVGPGEMIGEMALVGHSYRNSSVVARTPMVLVEFGLSGFERLLDGVPGARRRIESLVEARRAENEARRPGR